MKAGLTSTLSAMALAACFWVGVGQHTSANEETITDKEVKLDWPAIAIYPAGDGRFLTLSQDGTLELRMLDHGEMLDRIQLNGIPVSVSEALSDRGTREFAFVLEMEDDESNRDSYALQFVSTDGRRLGKGRLDQNMKLQFSEFLPMSVFSNPAILHGLRGVEGNPSTYAPVVLWDRTDDPNAALYYVFGDGEIFERKAAFYPTELIPIGLPGAFLGIQGNFGEAFFFDVELGDANGNIFNDALTTRPTRRPDRTPMLVTFAPRTASGGTGRAVVANLDNGALTVLDALPSHRGARLAQPVYASLPALSKNLIDLQDVRLVGDDNLTRMYLALTGTDEPAQVWGFDGLKGGLEALEPIQLPYPIRDLKRFELNDAYGGGLYGILSGDGRTVRFVDDIARAFSVENNADPLSTRVTMLAVTVPQNNAGADVLTVQRTLASLGYNVGTLDGISGPVTENAIRAFQLDSALEPTGKVDEATAALLQERLQSSSLGLWHALIASHTPDERGCSFAVDDVSEFARLLKGRAEPGTEVYIVRTNNPTVYAVAISTGDDRERARELSNIIRQVSPRSADGKTGVDSFVTTNKGWREDEACRVRAKVQ